MPDTPEFVELLVRHQHDLLRYVAPLVGNLADAQDVLQETAKALWKKFGEYDPQRPFLPWARTFARHEVLMHHRRRRRYTFLSEELIEQLTERQAQRDDDAERRRAALEQCLAKLAPDDRRLIERRYREDGSIDALAGEIGRTANVLYKSLGRVRRTLLECIERTLAADPA